MPSRIVDSDGVADEFDVGADGTVSRLPQRTRRRDPLRVLAGRGDRRSVPPRRPDRGLRARRRRPPAGHGQPSRRASRADLHTGGPAAVDPRLRRRRDHPRVRRRRPAATGSSPPTARRPTSCSTTNSTWSGVRFANGDTVGFERDEFGRETAVDVDGSRWTIDRDQAGRVVKLTDPAGVEAEAEHDPLGQWTSIADSTGQRWQLERGLIDRVRRLRTPTGEHEATYTAEGLLASTSSSDGRSQDIRYTAAGRIASIAEGGQWIEYRYDPAGRMSGVNGGTGWWQFEHDANGRMVRRVSPAGREQRYGYDVRGNPASITVGRRTRGRSSTTRGDGSGRSPIRPGAPRRSPTTSAAGWSPRRTPAACRCATPTTGAGASPSCSTPAAGRCRTGTTPSTS